MNTSLSITLQDPSVGASSSYWIALRQVEEDGDKLSIKEAAEFIDALYDSEPCEQEQEGGEEAPVENGEVQPPVPEEDFVDLAGDFLARSAICQAQDGSWTCQVIVARSHQDQEYRLVLDNGEAGTARRIEERASRVLSPEQSASETLDLPLLGNLAYQWEGPVFDRNGACAPPVVTPLGSTLNFGKQITGTLRVHFDTVYDQVDCTINALPGSTDPAPCRALAFFAGLVEELELEPPRPDDDGDERSTRLCPDDHLEPTPDSVSCYEIVRRVTRCRCSGDEVDAETVEQGVECPKGYNCPGSVETCRQLMGTRQITADFVPCDDEENLAGTVSDPDYYLDKCCGPPNRILPACKKITSQYGGGKGMSAEVMAGYPGAVFVPVPPKDGICGEITVSWQVDALDCCDGVPPLAIDPDTSVSVIAPGSSGMVVLVEDVGGPYTWSAGGSLYFDVRGLHLNKIETTLPMVRVSADEDFCGMGSVHVTDGCSSDSYSIRSTEGEWVQILAWRPFTQNGGAGFQLMGGVHERTCDTTGTLTCGAGSCFDYNNVVDFNSCSIQESPIIEDQYKVVFACSCGNWYGWYGNCGGLDIASEEDGISGIKVQIAFCAFYLPEACVGDVDAYYACIIDEAVTYEWRCAA